MEHIAEAVDLKEGEYLDGELYVHDMELNNIGRLIKKYRPGESEKVQLIVYDAPHLPESFKHRQKFYENKLKNQHANNWDFDSWVCKLESSTESIIPIFTKRCDTEKEVDALTAEALAHDFEGAILRNRDMKYRAGARSSDLIKIKEFDDGEWKIVDILEGKKYTLGDVSLPQARLILEINDTTFEVAAPGTKQEKSEFWINRLDYLGKMCTVKHSGFTEYGIPWHPICVRIRDDI